MGFGLEIRADNEKRDFDVSKDFYGTKFYGYTDPVCGDKWKTCWSARFLQSLLGEDIIEDIEYSWSTDDYEISSEDFKVFVTLYEYDFSKLLNIKNVLTQDPTIKAMLDTETTKILSWN